MAGLRESTVKERIEGDVDEKWRAGKGESFKQREKVEERREEEERRRRDTLIRESA